jgi:N-methylhydantoinase A
VRYRRQAYELTLPVGDGAVTRGVLERLAASFHDRHEQTYGHANRAEAVQLVNLRLTAVGRLPDLKLVSPVDPGSARVRQRDVWFAATGFVPAYVHWRNGLAAGMAIAGPAIIEAMDSTTVVPPGWIGRIDDLGYIRLLRN